MRAALDQVRAEQGADAVILSSRRVKEGIEVIAAVDYDEALIAGAARQYSISLAAAAPPEPPAAAATRGAGSATRGPSHAQRRCSAAAAQRPRRRGESSAPTFCPRHNARRCRGRPAATNPVDARPRRRARPPPCSQRSCAARRPPRDAPRIREHAAGDQGSAQAARERARAHVVARQAPARAVEGARARGSVVDGYRARRRRGARSAHARGAPIWTTLATFRWRCCSSICRWSIS